MQHEYYFKIVRECSEIRNTKHYIGVIVPQTRFLMKADRKIFNDENLLPVRLVEAISRDVSTQLLKVLGTRRLMYIPYEEFEKVMAQCSEVFTTWDDEYDKLQGLMRDIVKKKRDEHLKMVWRVNCSHKRLQVPYVIELASS